MGDVWPSGLPLPPPRAPAPGTIWLVCRNRTDEVDDDPKRSTFATLMESAQTLYMGCTVGIDFDEPLQQPCVHIEYLVIVPCTMCTCPPERPNLNCRNHRCCTVPVDHPHLRPEEATERPRVHFISVATAVTSGTVIQADPGHVEHILYRYHSVIANAWELARLLYYATSCGFGKYRSFENSEFLFHRLKETETRWQISAESIVRPETDALQIDRFKGLKKRYCSTSDDAKRDGNGVFSLERCLTATLMEELARTLMDAGRDVCSPAPSAVSSSLKDTNRIIWLRTVILHCSGIHKALARECRNQDGSIDRLARRRAIRKGRLLMKNQPASFICVESVMNAFLFAGLSTIGPTLNPAVTEPPLAVLALAGGGRVSPEATTNVIIPILSWDPSLDIPLREPHGIGETIFEAA